MRLKNEKRFISAEDVINNIIQLSKVQKTAFISAIIFFIIVHAGFFGDRLVNEDSRHFLTGWTFIANPILGRIFGNILTSYLNPWTLGVISAIYIASTSLLTISLFRIKTKAGAILASAIIAGFPGLAYMYSYYYSANLFSRIIFFAVLAVWLTQKYKYGFLFGAIAFVISLGSGQYGLSIAMVLCLLVLLTDIADRKTIDKDFFVKAIKLFAMGIVGLIVYLALVKIVLIVLNTELSTYKGFNQIGDFSLIVLSSIKQAYINFFEFFFGDKYFYVSRLQKMAYVLLFSVLMLKFINFVKRIKRIDVIFCGIALLAMIPLAFDIIGIVAPKAGTYTVALYQMVFVIIFPIRFFELNLVGSLNKGFHWLMAAALLMTVVCNYSITSVYYLKANAINEYTMLFENRLFSRIEAYPNFDYRKPIAIISDGTINYNGMNRDLFPTIYNDQGFYLNYVGLTAYTSAKTVSLMENYLGVNLVSATEDQVASIKLTEDYNSMGTYPAEDGIKIINDILVVNLMDYKIDINKTSNNSITAEFVAMSDVVSVEDKQTAWYVYKDGVRYDKAGRWYEPSQEFSMEFHEDGVYYFQCFYSENEATRSIKSLNVTVQNGTIISQSLG